MKVFNELKYEYLGNNGVYHIFKSRQFDGIDEEIVLVRQAKVIDSQGGTRYYNFNAFDSMKIEHYSFQFSNRAVHKISKDFRTETEQRVRLTQFSEPVHIPKRSIAGDEALVKTNYDLVVSRKKMVRAWS